MLFSRAVVSGKQLTLARALVTALSTAVLAKLSRLAASCLVGSLIESSVKYASTAFRRSDDWLEVHALPAGSPAWTTTRFYHEHQFQMQRRSRYKVTYGTIDF